MNDIYRVFNRRIAAALAMLLAAGACGESKPNWSGGLVGIWEPSGAAVAILILHQGHDSFYGVRYGDDLSEDARFFASRDFRVFGFEMPPEPHHGPVERFYQPVIATLDALDAAGNTLPYYIAGVSGGGWTAQVVTALDARIKRGYSVEEGDPAHGDWEQKHPPLTYHELNHSAGVRLVRVYIPQSSSDCNSVESQIACVNDTTTARHEMSPWAAGFIARDARDGISL